MARSIHTLTTGEIHKILAIAPRKATQLIDDRTLKGFLLPGTQDRRVHLANLINFMTEHNFPRTRWLRFLEDHVTSEDDLGRYSIKEPIGRGNIRLYPEIPPYPDKPDIFTSGDTAELFSCAPRTVAKACDNGKLDHYRLPGGSEDRRITTDALVRYFLQEACDIPRQLEKGSFLSVNYPGGWDESQKVGESSHDVSVWYREKGITREVSIRCKDDGLYVKIRDEICNCILLGMTGRKEKGKIVHPKHLEQIALYFKGDFDWITKLSNSKDAEKAQKALEYSKSQFEIYSSEPK